MKEFQCLGSIIPADDRIDVEVDKPLANASKAFGAPLANASKAFGALGKAVFTNINLSLTTKGQVYKVCALSAAVWILLRKHLKWLNAFHHHCIHRVLGITNMRQ